MKQRYYYFLLITNTIINSFFYCPALLIRDISGFLPALFIALFISLLQSYLFISVLNYYEDKSIAEINTILFGKLTGKVFSMLHICLFLAFSFFYFRGVIEIVIEVLSPSGSILYMGVTLFFMIGITLLNSKQSFLRLMSFGVCFCLLYIGLIEYPLAIKNIHGMKWRLVEGAITHGYHLPTLASVASCMFFFGGVNNVSVFNSLFQRYSWKKTALVFILISIPVGITKVLIPAGIWGEWAAKDLQLVWVTTLDTVQLKTFVIERGVYALLPLFLIIGSIAILVSSFAAYQYFQEVDLGKFKKKCFLGAVVLVFLFSSSMIKNVDVLFSLSSLWVIIRFIYLFFYVSLLFIFTMLKKKKGGNSE